MLKGKIFIFLILSFCLNSFAQTNSSARDWNELVLEAIRNDFARPTIHARNLFHHSIICYDAWAAYDASKKTYLLGDTLNGYVCTFGNINYPSNIEEARNETIAYASFRFIKNRYASSPDYQETLMLITNLMNQNGYDTSISSVQYLTGGPAELGNYLAEQIQLFGYTDGSNEQNNFGNLYYDQVNAPLVMSQPGNPDIVNPNRWQPITLAQSIDQSGNIVSSTPDHLSPEWGNVFPFSLDTTMYTELNRDGDTYKVYADTNMPALLNLTDSSSWNSFYKWNHALVSIWQSHLDPSDSVMWDISPASIGNNTWYPSDSSDYAAFYNLIDGGDPSTGYTLNPITGLPYTAQVVPRGDYARVLAEFWADGIDSETPPGHWFEIYHYVTDQPTFERKWQGIGPDLSKLEYDVKAHLTLAGAMHDAAICAWSLKGYYDYIRPVSAVRYMAGLGQSSDTLLNNFDPNGIPLLDGYIELVEVGDSLAGTWNENVGKIKVYTWKGHEYISNTTTDVAGVGWILAENWWPYQRPTFVTPPFAGFVSGHSTFSRAGAQIMEFITGSEFFPGGLGTFHAEQDNYLKFEKGPSVSIDLQWATYRDASDQCSLSRLWGGIHPPIDDIPGRMIGEQVGVYAFNLADSIFSLESPALIHASISDSIINLNDIGNSFVVSLSFNVEMDTTVAIGTMLFPSALNSAIAIDNFSWITVDSALISFSVLSNEDEIFNTKIIIDNMLTATGIYLPSYSLNDFFILDTKKPELTLLDVNYTIINDLTVPQQLIIQLDFNEVCDTTQYPILDINSIGLVNPTLTQDFNSSEWQNDSSFIAYFDIVDFDESISNIETIVYNVWDAVENEMDTIQEANLFVIDTRNPQILNVVSDDYLISQADLASPQFDVVITFDEAMDTVISPEIQFSYLGVPYNSIIQNTFQTSWLDSINLNVQFAVYSNTNNLYSLDLVCTNLRDANNNILIDSIATSVIGCDMKSPEVLHTSLSKNIISDSLVGLAEYFIDVHFNEKMDTLIKPLVKHEANQTLTNSVQYDFVSSYFIDTTVFRAFFNVLDENIEVDSISVIVQYGQDFLGNVQVPNIETNKITIDTKNPKIIGLYANDYELDQVFDSLNIITLFDEEMMTSNFCLITFNPIISSPLVLTHQDSIWLNDVTFTSNYALENGPVQTTSYGINVSSGFDLAGNMSIPLSLNDFVTIYPVLNVPELNLQDIVIYPNVISKGQSILIKGVNNNTKSVFQFRLVNTQGQFIKDLFFNRNGNVLISEPLNYDSGLYYLLVNEKTYKIVISE